jgi:hypothetical protein
MLLDLLAEAMLICGALAGDGNDGNVRLPKTLGMKPPLTVF